AYIDRIPAPVKGELVRGDAYHKALAHAFSSIVIYKEKPNINEVLQVYSDTWDKRLADKIVIDEGEELYIPSVDFKDKDPGQLKDAGIELLKIYYNTILPKVIPHEVEVRKTTIYEGIPLLAYMDLIDWGGIIIDHKVKAKMFSEAELAKDLQCSFYALVLGKNETEFQFHTALALKKPEIKIIPIKRTRDDIDWVGRLIVVAWQQIQTGIFMPGSAGWWCAPDQCPYWGICRMPRGF
ncbi:unnamed protein product, partial [marine sediment metagenome]